jgi:large subunit ribosomal protein L6
MSRLIKKPIKILTGATATLAGTILTVKGPKGELTVKVPPRTEVKIEGENITVVAETDGPTAEAGTFFALTKNALTGVTEGFMKILEIEGVGYRAIIEGKELVLYLGYALPVRMPIHADVAVVVEKNTLKLSGIDKDRVGRIAAEIRALKKPEPYKGKGIHYRGEVIRRKVGKKAGAASS